MSMGILGRETNFDQRFFTDYEHASKVIRAVKALGQKVVLTSGTWDLLHIDHASYLERARQQGTFLVVGVDSDEKVKARKGPSRPFVPQMERAGLLAHLRHVDMIVLKPQEEEPRLLIKTLRPDILVISETTGHEDGEVEDMKRYCGEVRLIESMQSTSTTAQLRLFMLRGIEALVKRLQDAIPALVQETLEQDGKTKKKAA
ncbi:MAG TPA: adenylyltransferase/cytidyltransferase family protein [Candidatus Paceibacterota bacterium]|nr:adenylyltransferase/cytidyltransferase family protein [Candidatus Paceibacterota bacterium]